MLFEHFRCDQVSELFNQVELIFHDDTLYEPINGFIIDGLIQLVMLGGLKKIYRHFHIDFIPASDPMFFLHNAVMRIENSVNQSYFTK